MHLINLFSNLIITGMLYPVYPPTKRPNKDPMPSHRPSNEQFAAMMAAAGHTLTRHHVTNIYISVFEFKVLKFFVSFCLCFYS